MEKISQNSISLSILSLKITKSPPRNPIHKGFPTILRAYPRFSKILSFDFVEIYF
jgi:hypothetical protein